METHVKKRTETYFKILCRLRDLFQESKNLQKYFNLTKTEIKLLKTDHGFYDPVVFGRFDSVLTPEDGLRVYELNTNCAATPGWVEMLGNVIEEFPFWNTFQKKHNITYYNHWYKKLRAGLMKQYQAWGGKDTHPPILMLRWGGQYNQDSDMICQALQRMGHHVVVGDPVQVHYRDGKLDYHGTQYDLVLRWFDMDHLLNEVGPLYQDLLRASYDNAVCILNPLSSAALAHKAFFAFFTDEQFDEYITPKEREILGNMCPWTRIIEKRKTTGMTGYSVDLLEYIRDNRKKLIIKPSIGTYGANVFIGIEQSDQSWRKIIKKGLKHGGWIAQEYIKIPKSYEPYITKKGLITKKLTNHDFGPYMINGKYAGGMARTSHNLITNLMQDGCFQMLGVIKK